MYAIANWDMIQGKRYLTGYLQGDPKGPRGSVRAFATLQDAEAEAKRMNNHPHALGRTYAPAGYPTIEQ